MHYEIVILIHPEQSERLNNIIKKYKNIIEKENGKIHRLEDLGRRQLSYQIKKTHKAHYVLMNVECEKSTLKELSLSFKFNDSIIRNMVLRTKGPITTPSALKTSSKT